MNYIERDELNRILDLPNANRFPTENDIVFLRAHIEYLNENQIKQFKLDAPENEKNGLVGQLADAVEDKPVKAKKSPKIAAKKVVKAPVKKVVVRVGKKGFKLIKKGKLK